MILQRVILQAKWGRGDELVRLIKKARVESTSFGGRNSRLLTDLSGPFFTIVTETEFKSLADFEENRKTLFSQPDVQEFINATTPLIESGRQEFFTIED